MATNSTLVDFSNQLADAVATAAKALVTVKGRARQPASGVVYADGLVLTANHVLERDEDLSIVSFVGGPLRTGRGLTLEQYVRTDATPYPGFSGGPLVDAAGAVLGITTTGFGGAALAIPHETAWRVGKALTEHGTPKRGYIGISSQPVRLPAGSKQETGLLVVHVEDGSPAA